MAGDVKYCSAMIFDRLVVNDAVIRQIAVMMLIDCC